MQRILQNSVLRRVLFVLWLVAGALVAACTFTWAALGFPKVMPSRPSDVGAVAVPAAVVSLTILLAWQCAGRCKQDQHWHRVLATVLFAAMTFPSPWIGLEIASWVAPYLNNWFGRSVDFSEYSVWSGCRGWGLMFIIGFGLFPAVLLAGICFAIYVHVRARSRYRREEYDGSV